MLGYRGQGGEIDGLRAARNAISAGFKSAAPEERAELYSFVPLPVRILLKTVFAWQYRRYVSRVRDGR